VGGLDEKVDMIVLYGELHDPEIGARGRGERAADRGEDPSCPKTTEGSTKCHVYRMP
jgi:hypothetical protein